MRKYLIATLVLVGLLAFRLSEAPRKAAENDPATPPANYPTSREPLTVMPYLELPLGAIRPEGWLREQLRRMASGLTGHLDEIYPEVVGERNGWLGGDGDGWERGPYWIDGLLPLAYLLDDDSLKAKAQRWVDWTLEHQTPEGYLGPVPFEKEPAPEAGLQRGMRRDWWPKMVMLKILQQYYNATQDERVLTALTHYFKYQLKELPDRPLDNLTFWANRRGGDNLQVVYWLYTLTGEEFLLDLGELIAEQTFPWTTVFTNDQDHTPPSLYHFMAMKRYPFDTAEINATSLSDMGSVHTVNFAQGLKQPAVLYQRTGDQRYIAAIKEALRDIKKYHGQAQGMYGGDEPLHGPNPVQGIEFCSVSEEMFSLETIVKITGDMEFADLLEKITYNALPTQASDDFTARQYFQAANQVELRAGVGPSFESNNHGGTDFVYGVLTGYPCCTTNMHQSWPKFVQNLFYATPDGGVAALQYAPSTVDMLVADRIPLRIVETTGYPFREDITFVLELEGRATFPFHLRIPAWAQGATVRVNGEEVEADVQDQVAIINREWQDGDTLRLTLPMKVTTSQWYEFSTAVERGPLVYALGVAGKEAPKNRDDGYGTFTEITPTEPWNFGLLSSELDNLSTSVAVVENEWDGRYPWNVENAPIALKTKALRVPEWKADDGVPYFPSFWGNYQQDTTGRVQEITLVPYGCTTLRISQFPTYNP